MPALRSLRIGDNPKAWSDVGFNVVRSRVTLGRVEIELVGTDIGRGILGWSLAGVDDALDGLPVAPALQNLGAPGQPIEHDNGVFGVDHVVIQTSDIERTVATFEAAGMAPRRRSILDKPDGTVQQVFFWAGRTIVELIGPGEATAGGDRSAQFWGLALVSDDLDRTAEVLGDALSKPVDAVQPGRRIATLSNHGGDLSVPIAIMSPHVSAGIEQMARDGRASEEPPG